MHLKLGTYVATRVASRDNYVVKSSRSHGHMMYAIKMCNNSVPGGRINFILDG